MRHYPGQGDYTWDPDEAKELAQFRSRDNRCTPEKLLAFIKKLERSPTLAECKQEFGGLWGVFVSAWELQNQGVFPADSKPQRKRRYQ